MNTKMLPDQGELLENAGRYRRLTEKLNYLMVTTPDITFTINIVSQFLLAPRTTHLEAVVRILRYLKKASRREFFYSDHGNIRVAGFSDADWAWYFFDRRLIT